MPVQATQPDTSHLPEDTLESYALGRLSEPELERVETHLLTCHSCQDALDEADAYVTAMKAALVEPSPESVSGSAWWNALTRRVVDSLRFPRLVPAGALAAVFLAVAISQTDLWRLPGEEVEVTLRSMRADAGPSTIPANTRLGLKIQSQYLRMDQSFSVKIVNAEGRQAWAGVPQFTHENGYVVHVNKSLRPGNYWVRLYDAQQAMLQEYGLRLE
jgi:hypothetical protein